MKARFEGLMEKIGPLRQLAAQQGIHKIGRLEDAAPLLFGPKVHKSYPLSLLEGNHFDKLTRWLGRLTTHDLSRIDVSGCDTIDGLARPAGSADADAGHAFIGNVGQAVHHSPQSHRNVPSRRDVVQVHGRLPARVRWRHPGIERDAPIFLPTYRHGRHVQRRWRSHSRQRGSDEHFICAFPAS